MNFKNQDGQALLFVVVVMTVALSVGVGVSLRTLSTISRVTTSDTSSRVQAAAEGGIERFLVLSEEELAYAMNGECSSIVSDTIQDASTIVNGKNACRVIFESVDDITSVADVVVEEAIFGGDSETAYYPMNIEKNRVGEVNLEGYTGDELEVCWSAEPESESDRVGSDMSFLAYTYDGQIDKYNVQNVGSLPGAYVADNFFSADVAGEDKESFTDCYTITLSSSSGGTYAGLRIMPINRDATVGVYPTRGTALTGQGYKISAYGTLLQNNEIVAVEGDGAGGDQSSAIVFLSRPYLPHIFNFALYSESGTIQTAEDVE